MSFSHPNADSPGGFRARAFTLDVGAARFHRPRGLPQAVLGEKRAILSGHLYRIKAEDISRLSPQRAIRRVLECWAREGDAVLAQIVGEFTLVRFDTKGVQAYRSLNSPFQLYFTRRWVGNRLADLLHCMGTHSLNEQYLWRYLFRRETVLYECPETPFRGVSRLPAGHLLRTGPNESPSTRWIDRPDYAARDHRGQRVCDVAPALLERMREVIADRVHRFGDRPLVCQVSGGLDSSFIASLVGERCSGVRALMYSYPKNPSHRSSEACAQAVARRYGMDLRILRPETFLPHDLSAFQAYADEPSHFSWQGAVFGRRLREYLPPDSVLFCGSGSDQLFYRQPAILPWLLRRGKVRDFFASLRGCSRTLQRGTVNLAYQSLLATLPGYLYVPLLGLTRTLPLNPFSFEDVSSEYKLLDSVPWLSPARVADAAALQRKILKEERDRHGEWFGRDAAIRAPLCALADPQMGFVPYFDPHPVDYVMPFHDPRLMEWVYREVGWHLIHDWDNPYKHLLREAQRDVVPEETRTRKRNEFHFSGFLSELLNHNGDYLRTLLSDTDLDGFDVPRLRSTFDRLLFGVDNNASRSLLALITFLLWRRDFETEANATARRPSDWEPVRCETAPFQPTGAEGSHASRRKDDPIPTDRNGSGRGSAGSAHAGAGG